MQVQLQMEKLTPHNHLRTLAVRLFNDHNLKLLKFGSNIKLCSMSVVTSGSEWLVSWGLQVLINASTTH